MNLIELQSFLILENLGVKVHITQGDHEGKGLVVSWITPDEPGSSTVLYWAENSQLKSQANGFFLTYKFFNYTSGYIHHCTINNLEVCTFPKLFFFSFLSSFFFFFFWHVQDMIGLGNLIL